ncbi:hypothetical protein EW146_g5687 [Bondarzewia mesenterica]|uniref:Uncharacterized protein n=1 Tax=Bondarzewia mesenterica TaxID=1095465 RepID=A0A4S4LQT0_9AGAM|nr:hypothetical protein EW146_g5687 [Bondarzewia mesenterica]
MSKLNSFALSDAHSKLSSSLSSDHDRDRSSNRQKTTGKSFFTRKLDGGRFTPQIHLSSSNRASVARSVQDGPHMSLPAFPPQRQLSSLSTNVRASPGSETFQDEDRTSFMNISYKAETSSPPLKAPNIPQMIDKSRGSSTAGLLLQSSAFLSTLSSFSSECHKSALVHTPSIFGTTGESFSRNSAQPQFDRSTPSSSLRGDFMEDDISMVVLKGLSDLKHAKYEIEEQRREIVHLRSQLGAAKDEKEESIQRLNNVKNAARKAIESSSASLQEMRTTLHALRQQSDEAFAFATQARSCLPDVIDMRHTIEGSFGVFESLLDGDGKFIKGTELKQIITELQMECSKTRQANDLLHDKLTEMTSQLIETRDRVRVVETSLDISNRALEQSNATLLEHVTLMKKAQVELSDALIVSAGYERKSISLEKDIKQLKEKLEEGERALNLVQGLEHKNVRLQSIIEDRDNQLRNLSSVKEEHALSTAAIKEHRAEKVRMLETLSEHMQSIEKLNTKCTQLETQSDSNFQMIDRYEDKLKVMREREEAVLLVKENLAAEKATVEKHATTLEIQLVNTREELNDVRARLQQMEVQFSVLQERFTDQSTTLKLTKEANGDVQERLLVAETTYARTLEAKTGKLQREISVIKEKNKSFEHLLKASQQESDRYRDLLSSAKVECEGRLEEERKNGLARIQDAQEKASQAEQRCAQAQTDAEGARTRLTTMHREMDLLKLQSENASRVSSSYQADVDSLNTQIHLLQTDKLKLTDRAKSIMTRYRTDDLSDEEKLFVNALMEESQALHENAIYEKQNELRRSKNRMADLELKIAFLEKSLARHLNTEKPDAGNDGGRSILDLDPFMSSAQRSSSSENFRAPDSDGPATDTVPQVSLPHALAAAVPPVHTITFQTPPKISATPAKLRGPDDYSADSLLIPRMLSKLKSRSSSPLKARANVVGARKNRMRSKMGDQVDVRKLVIDKTIFDRAMVRRRYVAITNDQLNIHLSHGTGCASSEIEDS